MESSLLGPLILSYAPKGFPLDKQDSQVRSFLSADYKSVISANSGFFQLPEDITAENADISEIITCATVALGSKTPEDQLHTFLLAASLLQLFLQINFTGPTPPFTGPGGEFSPAELFSAVYNNGTPVSSDVFSLLTQQSLRSLTVDGEPAYSLTKCPFLLTTALAMLEQLANCARPLALCGTWWLNRALVIHQSLLNADSGTIFARTKELFSSELIRSVKAALSRESPEVARDVEISYCLERARMQLSFIQVESSSQTKKLLEAAAQLSGFSFELTGLKGRRTKFQQTDVSQLVVQAESRRNDDNTEESKATEGKSAENAEDTSESISVPPSENSLESRHPDASDPTPVDHPLNSDVLLEKPQFTGAAEITPLADVDSIILLLEQHLIKRKSPHVDPLIIEERQTYISRITNSPAGTVNWSVFSQALWTRSVLESMSAKTVERGTLQMQSLVDELNHSIQSRFIPASQQSTQKDGGSCESCGSGETASTLARLKYIHLLPPLPVWSLEATLAQQYMSLGVLKSALEIYERLDMWGEAALCYAAVGNEKAAVELLESRLRVEPDNARALTILGDLKGDPSYWLKAWEIGRYAPAKKSLGKYYWSPPSPVPRDLNLCIAHLHDALSVNPLDHSTWFVYGCAGLETEQYELAAEAFTRCVGLDETDGKSWSNLSTALLRLGKTREAFNALKKAVRTMNDGKNWKVWSNYLNVAAGLGEWDDVLLAEKTIVDLRKEKEGESAIEETVVEQLVAHLVASEKREQYTFFQRSCVKFVCEEVASLVTSSPDLYMLIAKVEMWRGRPSAALECYEKGFRIFTHHPELELKEEVWNKAVDMACDLCDAYESLGEQEKEGYPGTLVCKEWKFKCRNTIRLLMGKGKAVWQDSEGWEKLLAKKEEIASL